jgi:hypothetical protein
MDPTPKKLELVPLDEPDPNAPFGEAVAEIEIVPLGKMQRDNSLPTADRFLKEATQQYEEGHIDRQLWDRALAQAGNDKTAAIEAYLRARATVLRLLDRSRRARRSDTLTAVPVELGADTVTPGVTAPAVTERVVRPPRKITRHRHKMFAGAAVVFVGLCVWLLIGYLGHGSTSGTAVARSAPASVQPVTPQPALASATITKAVATNGSKAGATPEFVNKIQQLNDEGNWNVLVLYAVEWTRLEPANPAAWNQLRAGYVNLRQYRDALDAATKAVQLAPADSRMWRNLGQADLDLNDPAEALRAFDQALVVSPDDAMARCLRNAVVQLMAPQKDPRAPAKPPIAADTTCAGLIAPVAAR